MSTDSGQVKPEQKQLEEMTEVLDALGVGFAMNCHHPMTHTSGVTDMEQMSMACASPV